MDELRDYVEKLFSDRKETSETADLKEEILSNMIAKKNDLVSQGMSEDEAIRKAKESLPSLEGLLEEKRPRPLKKTKRLRRNLIILAAAFFVFFLFLWILAIRYSAQPAQDPANWNAPTHDIFTIVDYRSAYVGDISNVAGLYQHLPMGNIEKKYELDPDTCTLIVNYLEPTWDIGEEKVRQDLVYNTIAAMASIDNLAAVTYEFPGYTFSFAREQVEEVLGKNLASLLDADRWGTAVQRRITDEEFLEEFYE